MEPVAAGSSHAVPSALYWTLSYLHVLKNFLGRSRREVIG